MSSPFPPSPASAVYWFRKSLRLSDNPSLVRLLSLVSSSSSIRHIYFVFTWDPFFVSSGQVKIGANRWRFLAESLADLNSSLSRDYDQRLLVLKGNPLEILPEAFKRWNTKYIAWEQDHEAYALIRDKRMKQIASELGVEPVIEAGQALFDLERIAEKAKNKHFPTVNSFKAFLSQFGPVPQPLSKPERRDVPPFDSAVQGIDRHGSGQWAGPDWEVPTVDNMGLRQPPPLPSLYPECPADASVASARERAFMESSVSSSRSAPNASESRHGTLDAFFTTSKSSKTKETNPSSQSVHSAGRASYSPYFHYFVGGETDAFRRLDLFCQDQKAVATFAKPETSPNSMVPSTTTLSPYLKFGCISARTVWWRVQRILDLPQFRGKCTAPPVSLHGQLLFREYFYYETLINPNISKMVGNPICKQIPWSWASEGVDAERFEAWKEGKTGFPWIDACMIQLKIHGFIHHLGRHAVACFLTRGDLFIHWERGLEVFQERLVDHDEALNANNWLWLSASAHFHQYWRVYSPITFGKKTDPNGDFVRHFIPALRNFPAKYIYEPWNAPIQVQTAAGCIIGRDYPKPIVDHAIASKECMAKMKAAYEAGASTSAEAGISNSNKRKADSSSTTPKSKK